MHRLVWAGLVVAVLALAVFAPTRHLHEIDGRISAYVACALRLHGTFALDDLPEAHDARVTRWVGAHRLSKYGIGVPILAAAFFRPADCDGHPASWPKMRRRAELAAGAAVVVTGLLLYALGLRAGVTPCTAALLAMAVVLGTSLWSSASRTLFQHGFVTAALLGIMVPPPREGGPSPACASGAFCSAAPPRSWPRRRSCSRPCARCGTRSRSPSAPPRSSPRRPGTT